MADKDKDYERYMSKEFKKRNAVYDPESSYLKARKKSEEKYLDSSKDSAQRVRRLQVIADETDPNVPTEKAKYRRGHVPTNEALYGMRKGGKVKKMATGGEADEKSLPRRMYEKVMGTPEQNEAAQKRMDERDKKNPDTIPAKINRAAKAITGKKKGGYVSAADGCAQRGKTKGRMV